MIAPASRELRIQAVTSAFLAGRRAWHAWRRRVDSGCTGLIMDYDYWAGAAPRDRDRAGAALPNGVSTGSRSRWRSLPCTACMWSSLRGTGSSRYG
jgi:hypothetical protein